MENIHHERALRSAANAEGGGPGPAHPRRVPESDGFTDALEQFVCEGLRGRERVVVIATMAHLFELERRLGRHEFQFAIMQARGQYTRLNAHEALWQFMVDGRPDTARFQAFAGKLLTDAGRDGRKVRAHCEMAEVLRGQGKVDAGAEVERLWSQACDRMECRVHTGSDRSVESMGEPGEQPRSMPMSSDSRLQQA